MNTKIIMSVVKFIGKHKREITIAVAASVAWWRDRRKQFLKGQQDGMKTGYYEASQEWAKIFQELENKYQHTAKTIDSLNDLMREYIEYKEHCTSESEKQQCEQRIKEILKIMKDLTKEE